MTLDQLKVLVSSLPDDQRADLAQHLLNSLESVDQEARSEWLTVAEERMAEIRAGKVIGIPADEVLKNLLGPGR